MATVPVLKYGRLKGKGTVDRSGSRRGLTMPVKGILKKKKSVRHMK
jgi:hypothetical protein